MNKKPLREFFGKSQSLSPGVIDIVVEEYEERYFDKDEFLIKEGKKINDSVILIDGLMRAYTFDTRGNEVTTNFFSRYRAVYDPASFFQQAASIENIQAVTPCQAYSISYEKVNKLFHAVPGYREFGRLMLLEELILFKQRTLALINRSAEERYADLIKNNNDILRYAPLKYIASYLGVTDTSLSRIRRNASGR